MSWKTVTTYINPTDSHIARATLEAQGIEVSLKDELTIQTDNFLANAIGGVKVQVLEINYELAKKILLESQLMFETKQTKNKYLTQFNSFTSKLPIIGKWVFEIRLLAIVGILLLILSAFIYYITLTSSEEKLTNNKWCVNTFQFQNENYEFYTTHNMLSIYNCEESIIFNLDKTVKFPGVNTNSIIANWNIENDKLIISNSKDLKNVYNGTYNISFPGNLISLESENTRIIGYIQKAYW